MSAKINYKSGDRFYHWTLIEYRGMSKWRAQQWLCRCDCGTEMVMEIARLKHGRSKMCKKCSNRHKRRVTKPVGAYAGLPGEKPTDAICPRCGRRHTVQMYWTGKGMPKKFCEQCKASIDTIGVYYQAAPQTLRGARI